MRQMNCYAGVIAAVAFTVFAAMAHAGRPASNRCGCSEPYVAYSSNVSSAVAARQPAKNCLTAAWTEMQVVLVPTTVTEKRTVCCTGYKEEERSRVVTGCKMVPITEERIRLTTVSTPKTETKTINYTSQVAIQSEEEQTYTVKVPVWEDREETYLVKVPVLNEVEESYTVKVPVLKDVQCNYTVNVPTPVTQTGVRMVCNVVPVVKTRNVNFCVPVSHTKATTVDRGHWEYQTAEQSAGRGNRRQQAPRQIWVANLVNEETSTIDNQQQTAQIEYLVYEQHNTSVPYECACIEYRPEVRTGTKQEVVYEDETRTRMRTAVSYRDEQRSRIKKVLTFKEEQRSETYPVVKYQPETLSKEVSYTVYVPETKTERYTVTRQQQVPDHRIENYTVRVAVPEVREVDVQVTRMVPKVVSVTVNPCGGSGQTRQPRNVTMVPATAQSLLVSK